MPLRMVYDRKIKGQATLNTYRPSGCHLIWGNVKSLSPIGGCFW